jgi:hypothetical protein
MTQQQQRTAGWACEGIGIQEIADELDPIDNLFEANSELRAALAEARAEVERLREYGLRAASELGTLSAEIERLKTDAEMWHQHTARMMLMGRRMRRFHLERDQDVSGISGTGTVAEGVEFRDGQTVVKWLTHVNSLAVYPDVVALVAIHGHNGLTRLVWDDDGP